MQFAKFLELLFFPSNILLILFLILAYDSFAMMSIIDMFVYSLAIVGLPLGFFIMNKKSRRKNRAALISLSIVITVFTILSFLFPSLRSLRFLYLSTYSFLILGLLLFLIRFKWKISLHVSFYTACITVLTIFNINFLFFYVFVPLIAWCRIKLKVHTFYQTLAGFLVGLTVSFVFLF